MYLAHIQDSNIEEPEPVPPVKAPTSLQAVTESLGALGVPHAADDFVEGLFRRGYAVIPIESLPSNLIFKGRQA